VTLRGAAIAVAEHVSNTPSLASRTGAFFGIIDAAAIIWANRSKR
jgi:hypothetical protein